MIEAHLDAGWRKLEALDPAGARREADLALAHDAASAEAHFLDGAVARLEGDDARALAAFRRALELDDGAVDPALWAAEVCRDRGDLGEARALAAQALDRAEEEEDFVEALLFKADLELADDDDQAAAETLTALPPAQVALPAPEDHVVAGDFFFQLDQLDPAEAHAQAALGRMPDSADAHHLAGLVAEARGDPPAQLVHFLRVRELDLALPEPAQRLSLERIEECAQAALGELPDRARELLGNVPLLIEETPSEALVRDGVDPRLLGLFTGVPHPEQTHVGGPPPHLECVLLFRRNLERDTDTVEDLEEQIRVTVLHETAHFFGLDEADLEAIGLD